MKGFLYRAPPTMYTCRNPWNVLFLTVISICWARCADRRKIGLSGGTPLLWNQFLGCNFWTKKPPPKKITPPERGQKNVCFWLGSTLSTMQGTENKIRTCAAGAEPRSTHIFSVCMYLHSLTQPCDVNNFWSLPYNTVQKCAKCSSTFSLLFSALVSAYPSPSA